MNRPGMVGQYYVDTNLNEKDFDDRWVFTSTRHWGENGISSNGSTGNWQLRITDGADGDTGWLWNWKLSLFGSEVTSNNTYIYTNEYANFTGTANASRRVLNDNGGVDTINISAVSGNVQLNLISGQSSTFAGNSLKITDTTVIENAFTGDGNDQIIGNSANNILNAGRGQDNISGGIGNDALYGAQGNDSLVGGDGNDILDGGADIDTASYEGALTGVTVNLGLITAQNTLGAGSDTLKNIENLIGSNSADTLTGSHLNNELTGNDGNDTLNGMAGADTMIGGNGDDTYYVDNAGDIVTEQASQGTDTVASYINYTLGSNLENLTLVGTAAINGTGNAENNVITGNAANNTIDGGAGNDILNGGAGIDILSFASAGSNVTINLGILTAQNTGGAGIDTVSNFENILGSAYNDTLTGNTASNTINGGAGNDTIDGGTGKDTLIGGVGNDTYIVANTTTQIIELDNEGNNDEALSSISYSLANNLEKLTLNGIASINGTGNALNNTLVGNSGNNILNGMVGADTMNGGAGNDTYYVDNVDDTVIELVNEGTDTVASYINYTLAGNIENLTLVGTAAINGTGNAGNNNIIGNAANNTIDGAAGNDLLNGGAGIDTLSYVSAGSNVTINLGILTAQNTGGAGIDTISNFENILGSAFNDILTGNAANNTIDGAAGNDTLNGGAGIDTLSYVSAGSNVTINLGILTAQNTGGAGTDTISNFENILGSAYNDTLTGNTASNTIEGGAGNDTLDGGAGADRLIGGDGDDTFINGIGNDTVNGGDGSDIVDYSASTTQVKINLNLTTAQIVTTNSGSDIFLNIENVLGSLQSDTLIGNSANNVLRGGNGNDYLEGGLGDDDLYGDAGLDTASYSSASSAVVVNLATGTASGGAGNDKLFGIENIIGSRLNDTLTGDGNNNLITGGQGNDTIDGGAGSDTVSYQDATVGIFADINYDFLGYGSVSNGLQYDTLYNIENMIGSNFADTIYGSNQNNVIEGGKGNDYLNGDIGIDTVSYANASSSVRVNLNTGTASGGDGTDQLISFENIIASKFSDSLYGTSSNNTIEGGAGIDYISGLGGNDILIGGTGNDTLNGGLGSDIFKFYLNDDFDTIEDFTDGLDKIDISAWGLTGFADLNIVTNSASTMITALNVGTQITVSTFGNTFDTTDFIFA